MGTPIAGPSQRAKRNKGKDQEKGGSSNAASTPVAGINSDTPIESLSTLVQEISSIIPCSHIDTLQTQEPTGTGLQIEIKNDLYEGPYKDKDRLQDTTVPYQDNGEAERKDLEESYREETVLVKRIKRMRRLQTEELRDTMGNRAGPADLRNRNRELREVMRPRSGPADLRNSHLNRDQDIREQMGPRSGPSDLRYCRLEPNREMRELKKPKSLREDENEKDSERLVTLLSLLRILSLGRIGSTKLVLPKWQKIGILNRDRRVGYKIKGISS